MLLFVLAGEQLMLLMGQVPGDSGGDSPWLLFYLMWFFIRWCLIDLLICFCFLIFFIKAISKCHLLGWVSGVAMASSTCQFRFDIGKQTPSASLIRHPWLFGLKNLFDSYNFIWLLVVQPSEMYLRVEPLSKYIWIQAISEVIEDLVWHTKIIFINPSFYLIKSQLSCSQFEE